jgi:arginine repressor|tara:strand:- start:433 stop:732 length:300 start_codon:yes stop_codon:yes gene_type:complete
MARQNNYYRINSSENLSATTSSGETRSGACPAQVTKVRIAATASAFVKIGPGADPTATVAAGVLINAGDADIFTVVEGDEIAAITASGTATVNISWLEG